MVRMADVADTERDKLRYLVALDYGSIYVYRKLHSYVMG